MPQSISWTVLENFAPVQLGATLQCIVSIQEFSVQMNCSVKIVQLGALLFCTLFCGTFAQSGEPAALTAQNERVRVSPGQLALLEDAAGAPA